MPEVGARVTVIYVERFLCAEVVEHHEHIVLADDGTEATAFVVCIRPNTSSPELGPDIAFEIMRGLLPDGNRLTYYAFDPDFVEGVGWARGWEGPDVDALKVARALA